MLRENLSGLLEQGISIPGAPGELSIIQRTNFRDQKVASISLDVSILIQSFILGLNLGITPSAYLQSMFIALIFQQGLEGLALGSALVKAHFSAGKYYLLLGAFVLTTPGAIGLGIGVRNSYQSNGKLALAFQGIFSAISAGFMMYHSITDILRPAFLSSMLLSAPNYQRYAATLCVCLGFAAMASLVQWF